MRVSLTLEIESAKPSVRTSLAGAEQYLYTPNAVRSVLARWLLLATAVALVLLGRPTEQLCAQRSDHEQASRGSADDVSLRSERRHTPVLRLAHVETNDDAWSVDLGHSSQEFAVLAASMRVLALTSAVRSSYHVERPSSVSARGPPAIRS